jgi:hypothetical protein
MDLKKISITLGIVLALGAIVGSGVRYDKSLVKAADYLVAQEGISQSIQKLNTRLDKSDLEAMARDIQRRMWLLEDQHGFDNVQKLYEYKCLKRDLGLTNKKIEDLKEK